MSAATYQLLLLLLPARQLRLPAASFQQLTRFALLHILTPPPLPCASPQATLFVNHLTSDSDEALASWMSNYGPLVRAFVVRAPGEGGAPGPSKGYGFVEFALPSSAKAALRAMEESFEIERRRLKGLEGKYWDARGE